MEFTDEYRQERRRYETELGPGPNRPYLTGDRSRTDGEDLVFGLFYVLESTRGMTEVTLRVHVSGRGR